MRDLSWHVTVNLRRRMVVGPHGDEMPFEVKSIRREALLEGLDEIGLTMKHDVAIAAFQVQDQAARPWVWQPGGTTPTASSSG